MIGADGREYGPISADQLRQWIGQGRANATTSVLPEGASEWKPLGSLPEFSLLFTSSASAPAPAPTPITPVNVPAYAVQAPRTNGFAVAGLALGILSITAGLCCCVGLPFSISGLIFSLIALSQINSHPERYTGKTMAVIAIALCALSLLIAVGFLCLRIASPGWDSNSHHGYRL